MHILTIFYDISEKEAEKPAVDNTPGPESDTIFVSGLGSDITKGRIAEYFGQIGVIKVRSII